MVNGGRQAGDGVFAGGQDAFDRPAAQCRAAEVSG